MSNLLLRSLRIHHLGAALSVATMFSLIAAAQPAFRIPITVTDSSISLHSATAYVGFHPNATNCIDPDTLRGFSDHWSEWSEYGFPYTPDALEVPPPSACLCIDVRAASYTPVQCRDRLALNIHQSTGLSQVDSFEIRATSPDPFFPHSLVWSVPSVIGEYCDSAVISGTVTDSDQVGNPITVTIRANLVASSGRYTSYPTRTSDLLTRFKLHIFHPKNPPPPPSQVHLVSPMERATNQSVDPTLSWNSIPLAQWYKCQIARDPAFGSVVMESTTSDTTKDIAGLEAHTIYYWRVSAFTPYGLSYYQIPSQFTTGGATSVDGPPSVAPSSVALRQNFPNPFNPSTTIEYALPTAEYVRLTVYNVFGQEIQLIVADRQNAGYKSATFDASNRPSGVYIYKLTAGPFVSTKKMVVLK